MKNIYNEKPNIWHFIIRGFTNKEEIYYCNKSKCKCIESDKTKKTFRLLGYLTVGLFVVIMDLILKSINGPRKYLVFFVSLITVFFLFDLIHWRFAKFVPVDDKNSENKEI